MNDTIALEIRDLGLIPYAEALAMQSDLLGAGELATYRINCCSSNTRT